MAARTLFLSALLAFCGVILLLGAAHHCGHGSGMGRKGLHLLQGMGMGMGVGSGRDMRIGLGMAMGMEDAPVPAPTCRSLDCPPYRLPRSDTPSDFEIREYSQAKWAETDALLDISFNKAGVTGFRRLFKYIQGDNVQGLQVPMTAPVLTSIRPSGGPFCSSSFTVKFFVPPEFSSNPPEPSAGLGVHIATLPRRCVAVRRFPGFASDLNIAQEAANLAQSLEGTPWANITALAMGESYSIAQYNSPFELLNRVNEVWVPFNGTDDCSPVQAVSVLNAPVLALE